MKERKKNGIERKILRDMEEVSLPKYIHMTFYFDDEGNIRTKEETDANSDYVNVVRCRNCRRAERKDHTHYFCSVNGGIRVDKDGYCYQGVKRNIYKERYLARKKEREEQEKNNEHTST